MTIEAVRRNGPELVPARDGGRIGVFVVFVLLIVATVPWRGKSYFEGAADPIVVIKALISLVGLALAVVLTQGRPARPVRLAPFVFLLTYLTITVFGGWEAGLLPPSTIIAVRVLLLAGTIGVLARCFDGLRLIGLFVAASGTVAAVAALTGLASLSEGRLTGGIPPLHPNELASTCALVILWCLWRVLAAEDSWFHLVVIAIAGLVLIATGSRTPLALVPLAALLLAAYSSGVRRRSLAIAAILAPVLLWLVAGTQLLGNLLARDQSAANVATLSNRTIAWQAALAPKSSTWQEWFGAGLSLKRIDVPGQYWKQQILDSSWISALVQGGLLGLGVCILWLIYSLATFLDSPIHLRALQLAIVVYLALRGVLESGLFDANTSFLALFLTLVVTPVRRGRVESLTRAPEV